VYALGAATQTLSSHAGAVPRVSHHCTHLPADTLLLHKQSYYNCCSYLDRADRDFGLGQIDAVRDHVEIAHNPFIVLVTFGEHCLHHLFPTIDHTNLHHFYPIFHQTCQEYGVKYKPLKFLQLCKGQFQLLAKNKPNPIPPEEVINWFCNGRALAQLFEALHYKPEAGGRGSIPDIVFGIFHSNNSSGSPVAMYATES
jgi:hypothetical protein